MTEAEVPVLMKRCTKCWEEKPVRGSRRTEDDGHCTGDKTTLTPLLDSRLEVAKPLG
jgi:hypothetical protein